VCRRDTFDETVTVVVREADEPNDAPLTVNVAPLIFVTAPNAKPPLPPAKPPGGVVLVPPPAGRTGLVPRRPPAKPPVHEPLTGCVIVMRLAVTTPLLLRVPVAMTHAPTFRLDRGAAACSVIVAEPVDTIALPFGLSEVVIVNVAPFTETIGPNNDPWVGLAAETSAASAAIARIINHHLHWSC
jgi:hypothetical protein